MTWFLMSKTKCIFNVCLDDVFNFPILGPDLQNTWSFLNFSTYYCWKCKSSSSFTRSGRCLRLPYVYLKCSPVAKMMKYFCVSILNFPPSLIACPFCHFYHQEAIFLDLTVYIIVYFLPLESLDLFFWINVSLIYLQVWLWSYNNKKLTKFYTKF